MVDSYKPDVLKRPIDYYVSAQNLAALKKKYAAQCDVAVGRMTAGQRKRYSQIANEHFGWVQSPGDLDKYLNVALSFYYQTHNEGYVTHADRIVFEMRRRAGAYDRLVAPITSRRIR